MAKGTQLVTSNTANTDTLIQVQRGIAAQSVVETSGNLPTLDPNKLLKENDFVAAIKIQTLNGKSWRV